LFYVKFVHPYRACACKHHFEPDRYTHDWLRADDDYELDDYVILKLPECERTGSTARYEGSCLEGDEDDTYGPNRDVSHSRCLQPDGTIFYEEDQVMKGRVVMSRSGELQYLLDQKPGLPYDFDRKDGLVGAGAAQSAMMFLFFLTWALCACSWACAHRVSKAPRFGEGEPTVIYLC